MIKIDSMRLPLLARFLAGRQDAILAVARSRVALWAGSLFVLSAGFAREYDGADLLREPWRLAIPWVASLAVSSVLFLAMRWILPADLSGTTPRLRFVQFLTCFWMTAPLAWLYAIPFERFLPEATAARANFLTLGFVALWRVLLITRVLAVLTHRYVRDVFFVVVLVADGVLLAAIFFSPVPPLQFMGGVRLTERELVIHSTAFMVGFGGFVSLPVWIIGCLCVGIAKSRQFAFKPVITEPMQPATHGRGLLYLAIASVLIWAAILPIPQREQRLRSAVERAMHQGRIDEGIAIMSAHNRSEFPPVWEPPPRVGYQERDPSLLDVLDAIGKRDVSPWVQEAYVDKVERAWSSLYLFGNEWDNEAVWRKTENSLQRFSAGAEFLRTHRDQIQSMKDYLSGRGASTMPATNPVDK